MTCTLSCRMPSQLQDDCQQGTSGQSEISGQGMQTTMPAACLPARPLHVVLLILGHTCAVIDIKTLHVPVHTAYGHTFIMYTVLLHACPMP